MSYKSGYAVNDNIKWPIATGRYVVGDPESSVAICTLASELDADLAFAIKGSCKTENLGIEKVIVNIISNPNIRFLILCGSEVTGHKTGKCFKALKEFGVDSRSKRIIYAPGPIPILGNLPSEAIERFRKQVEIVDLIGVEDLNEIRRVIASRTLRHGLIRWVVETDKGEATFITRHLREQIKEPEPTRLSLIDIEGNRYDIPDLASLDPESLGLLQKLI